MFIIILYINFIIQNTLLLLGPLALFKRHLLIRGYKTFSLKKEHVRFVAVTHVEGTSLFRGKGHFFSGPLSGDTSALKT